MIETITYRELANIHEDIQVGIGSSPAFKLFNKQRIQLFYKNNGHKINKLNEKMVDLNKGYVKHDAKGQVQVRIIKDQQGQLMQQLDFIDDEAQKKYETELNDFFLQTVELIM